MGPFVGGDICTASGEDGAVPYFWPIGDKHILLFCSHQRGAQYLVGDYDRIHHRFTPLTHGRFNFGQIGAGGVYAASATPDGQGGIYTSIISTTANQPRAGTISCLSFVDCP